MLNSKECIGSYCDKNTLTFRMDSEEEDCSVLLYNKSTKQLMKEIPFPKESRIGSVHMMSVDDENAGNIAYLYSEGDKIVPDYRGTAFLAPDYGMNFAKEDLLAIPSTDNFDWEGDKTPQIPYAESFFYQLHVRGFTRDASSKVKAKGTFRGVVEKIDYLKSLGITGLVFQPMYEFIELEVKNNSTEFSFFQDKINYWGYKEGFYFAPKAAYSFSDNPVIECKEMIKQLHKNGMEVIMQMYFPDSVNPNMISEILCFWSMEYHVDGFVLMGDKINGEYLASNPYLSDKKLIFNNEIPLFQNANKHIAYAKDDYMYALRKLLKGDENTLEAALYHMRNQDFNHGIINYLDSYQGFTLYDVFSYDYKHNQDNDEDNRDGLNYNCSWNCGEEGPSRKKKVNELRLLQMKNAFFLLMASAGTPMIFMGDEFGNSQGGNNNPYCQDNEISWVNWKSTARNKEIFEAFKEAVAFRKEYSVLRPGKPFRMMDTMACGYPDISYHGEAAWKLNQNVFDRQAGILYCGEYALNKEKRESVYFAFNFYWGKKVLALPNLPTDQKWSCVYSTDSGMDISEAQTGGQIQIPGRTICIYKSVMISNKHKKQK